MTRITFATIDFCQEHKLTEICNRKSLENISGLICFSSFLMKLLSGLEFNLFKLQERFKEIVPLKKVNMTFS